MRKLITTLYKGSYALIYYIEIQDNKRSFVFRPSIFHKENPQFVIHVVNGELIAEGDVEKNLISQAREEIQNLISTKLLENVNNYITHSFLH